VTNQRAAMSLLGAGQCARIAGEKSYLLLAELFIRAGQGPLRSGGIHVQYFENETCAGAATLGEHRLLEQGTGAWRLVRTNLVSPRRAGSVLVKLVAENSAGGGPFEVKFDNVLLKGL
jgi:hypothetical protein